MSHRTFFASACVIVAIGIVVAISGAQEKTAKATPKAQFEQLKKLAGEWNGKAGHDGTEFDATVKYKVTSAGSTVMETLFGGTDHEMITMYHLDGDSLLLTHYCAAGNQPRMKLQPSDNANKLVFKFLDGTNLDPSKDMHMHEATIEIVDSDHLRSAWTSYEKGKPSHTAKFDLKRKK